MIDWSVTPEQSLWLNLFAVILSIVSIAVAFCYVTADEEEEDEDDWEELMKSNSEYQPPKEK